MRTIQNVTKISLFAALLAGGAWLWAGPWAAAPEGGGGVEVEAEEGRDSVPVGQAKAPEADSSAPFNHFKVINPVPRYENGIWQPDTIQFLEEGTEKVVAAMPIKAMDTYKAIRDAIVAEGEFNTSGYYRIGAESRERLRSYVEEAGWAGEIPVDSVEIVRLTVGADDIMSVTDFIAVADQLYLFDYSNRPLAILAEYRVFNKRGELIAELRSNLGGLLPIVTQDGKWMAVRYGEEFAEHSLPMGLLFFDVEQQKAVYQEDFDTRTQRGWWIGYFPVLDYIVCVEDIGSSFNNLYSIYKLNEGKKYTKLFDETVGPPGEVVFENYENTGVYYYISRKYLHASTLHDKRLKKRATFQEGFEITKLQKQDQ